MKDFLAIEVHNLTRIYQAVNGRPERCALDELSLDVKPGELFGLLGPNGAGKTTLIKILTTILLPTSGEVHVLGHNVTNSSKLVREKIGLVLGGERGLHYRLTPRQTLIYWGTLHRVPPKELRNRVDELLNLVGLEARANERVERFSRGMKQRLHLARGLINNPDLLFLDEPTAGLDPTASAGVVKIVEDLNTNGTTIILTTHSMHVAETLCDRVAFIRQGKVISIDTPEVLKRANYAVPIIETGFVEKEDPGQDVVKALPGVTAISSSLRGKYTLRLESVETVPRVIAELGKLGSTTIRTVEPSLEDVYVKLVSPDGLKVT